MLWLYPLLDFQYWLGCNEQWHVKGEGRLPHRQFRSFFFYKFLCRLRSIATHRDHFVRRLSVRLSVRLSHFPKLCFAGDTCIPRNAATILYARLQTGRIMVWWCPSVRPSVRVSVRPSVRHSFPHFSPTCFDILIWNFVYNFIFMHVRSSSNAINFRHFLQELCSFLTSNSYKYAVFRTFLLHALTYWVQILYMTLF